MELKGLIDLFYHPPDGEVLERCWRKINEKETRQAKLLLRSLWSFFFRPGSFDLVPEFHKKCRVKTAELRRFYPTK
jgi:hypothetical protein